ncbi:BTB/POZ domain-containing protein KCTD6-like [Saccoglossus kowalevskii]
MRLSVPDDEIVNLNVGGKLYSTTRSTLTRYPDTMLGAMFSGRMPSLKDAQGNYFIDRNGDMFKYILEFLRNGSIILPEDFKEFTALSVEVDFYQVAELTECLAEMMVKHSDENSSLVEEFIEVELQHESSPSLTIYACDDILKSLPSIRHIYEQEQHVFNIIDWQSSGFTCSSDYLSQNTDEMAVNHLDIFKDLSRIGFRLVGTMAHGSKELKQRTWTFSRFCNG